MQQTRSYIQTPVFVDSMAVRKQLHNCNKADVHHRELAMALN